ncbi:hypothetical protein C5O19_13640 [Siphonobacter curvatus]|uniref:Uncharacterized protein n=1 Tax=Siphonobacter curvatus TaxID=2094562 RepID=A0A2S7ISP9_9BACT|nr:hypothetical protein C5O19_13640 [Siphonobacter curvatus]
MNEIGTESSVRKKVKQSKITDRSNIEIRGKKKKQLPRDTGFRRKSKEKSFEFSVFRLEFSVMGFDSSD